jgi:hypothetical protein
LRQFEFQTQFIRAQRYSTSSTNSSVTNVNSNTPKNGGGDDGGTGGGGKNTVEKQLLRLMDMWEVEAAVKLLRRSVEKGKVPNPNVVLNLQQQLANLGEVECLLDLHNFLKVR